MSLLMSPGEMLWLLSSVMVEMALMETGQAPETGPLKKSLAPVELSLLASSPVARMSLSAQASSTEKDAPRSCSGPFR